MLTVTRQKITIGVAVLVFGLGVIAFLIMEFSDAFHIPTPDEISAWVEGYGAAGPVVYLLLYAFVPTQVSYSVRYGARCLPLWDRPLVRLSLSLLRGTSPGRTLSDISVVG